MKNQLRSFALSHYSQDPNFNWTTLNTRQNYRMAEKQFCLLTHKFVIMSSYYKICAQMCRSHINQATPNQTICFPNQTFVIRIRIYNANHRCIRSIYNEEICVMKSFGKWYTYDHRFICHRLSDSDSKNER